MTKRRLIMNMTPLLDLIMILFFAQSLLLTDKSIRVEEQADLAIMQMQAETRESLRENDRRRDRDVAEREERIAERENHIVGLETRLERQIDEQQRMRQDLVERERAYVSAFENIIDMDRFLVMVRESDNPDADGPPPASFSDEERRKTAEQFAQSFVVMKKSSDALESHITVWIFYVCYYEDTDRFDLEFQANGKPVELSGEMWNFDSQERLANRIIRELTTNPHLPTPSGPVFPMWGTKGDVPKRVRDTFRTALPPALQEVNDIFTRDPATGGKGWPQAVVYSGSIAPLGNIPLVTTL
ncbi:MAG: hypothetical protein FWD31_03025 [Planctomycetaceae bacterium]|nr:hypothetical protein [Planctomycetaceae bacterium]